MDAYGHKDDDNDVKIKVEEFDARMFYEQNCVPNSQMPHQNPIKLTKPNAPVKDHTNAAFGRVQTERNNNFGSTSSTSFQAKKQQGGSGIGLVPVSNAYSEDTCAQCGKVFPGPISVRTHQIVHRIVPPKTKICCCGERFHLRSGLENHMRICRTSEILKQQHHDLSVNTVNSTYFARESPPKPAPLPPPPPAPPAVKQNLISIVTTCPNCGNGAVALADIHAEPITFHCSQCGQEIKNVMFVRILQDGAADANSLSRDSAGVTLPIKQDLSYVISDSGNHGC